MIRKTGKYIVKGYKDGLLAAMELVNCTGTEDPICKAMRTSADLRRCDGVRADLYRYKLEIIVELDHVKRSEIPKKERKEYDFVYTDARNKWRDERV